MYAIFYCSLFKVCDVWVRKEQRVCDFPETNLHIIIVMTLCDNCTVHSETLAHGVQKERSWGVKKYISVFLAMEEWSLSPPTFLAEFGSWRPLWYHEAVVGLGRGGNWEQSLSWVCLGTSLLGQYSEKGTQVGPITPHWGQTLIS